MRNMKRVSYCALVALLSSVACSPASAGEEGAEEGATRGGRSARAESIREPDAADLLVAPPLGAQFQAEASEAENESGNSGSTRYGTTGGFRAERAVDYVYLTDGSLEEVARYYEDATADSPHNVDMEDMFTDYNRDELDVQEESPAGLPPDEMEAMLRQYGEQGVLDEAELEESLENMKTYRKIYPKIKDVTLHTLEFGMEEEFEGRDEYRKVDVHLIRPYVDLAALEVRDRTAIIYTVHYMKRQAP